MTPDFFILVGPQGSGKSKRAAEIAALLGATEVVDEWDGISPVPAGALAVTNSIPVRASAPPVDAGPVSHVVPGAGIEGV